MKLRDVDNTVRWSNIYLIGFSSGDTGKNMEEATFKELMAEYLPELLKGSNSEIQFQAE